MNSTEVPSNGCQTPQRQPNASDSLPRKDHVTGDRHPKMSHHSTRPGYGEPTDQAGADEPTDQAAAAEPQSELDLGQKAGPFYDRDGLLGALGLTEQALATAVFEHRILGLTAGDGGTVYPAWQFYADGSTIPHLPEVLNILADGIDDPWTWALWLSAIDDDLGGLTSAQWLAAGHDPEPVLLEAARDAGRWRN